MFTIFLVQCIVLLFHDVVFSCPPAGNGAGLFFQLGSPHGAVVHVNGCDVAVYVVSLCVCVCVCVLYSAD